MLRVCPPWWREAPSIPSLGSVLTRDQITYLLVSFFCEPLHSCMCVYLNLARVTVMCLTSETLTLTCPTERVVGVKRGLQSESPQPDQMEVQDPPKQIIRSLKPGWCHPCQVGRYQWTTQRCLSMEMYKILNTLIWNGNKSVR